MRALRKDGLFKRKDVGPEVCEDSKMEEQDCLGPSGLHCLLALWDYGSEAGYSLLGERRPPRSRWLEIPDMAEPEKRDPEKPEVVESGLKWRLVVPGGECPLQLSYALCV